MTIGILGSGFGLYGYLPALVDGCGQEVLLPERYRHFLSGRTDVAHLADRIRWCPDETAVLDAADALVVARRPADQDALVNACLERSSIKRLLLEKPLAPRPELSTSLIQRIPASGRALRIGYTFRYAAWAKGLLVAREKGGLHEPVELVWHFQAHHVRTGAPTWKRQVSMGGGAIRFFGIHLIALLAELGYSGVAMSEVSSDRPDEADWWRATFTGPALPAFQIEVITDTLAACFSVRCGENAIRLPDPFADAPIAGEFDRRVAGLTELCLEFLHGQANLLPWYMPSVQLWSEVERVTKQVPRWVTIRS